MLCLSVLRATEQQRDLLSYNMYFPLGHVETYWNYSMTQCLMIRWMCLEGGGNCARVILRGK